MSSEWANIDVDAAVLTELAERVQVKGVAVEPLAALEPALLDKYDNVYGVVRFFKWKSVSDTVARSNVVKDAPVFFAQQTVSAACPTLALVNVLANVADKVDIGPAMMQFVSFSQDLDPETRGMQLEEYDPLRDAHNAFVPANRVAEEQRTPRKPTESWQCVVFVYKAGSIWELDGAQEAPILCGDATDETYKTALMDAARKCELEVSFGRVGHPLSLSAMAFVEDPITALTKKIDELRKQEKPVASFEAELVEAKKAREEGTLANTRRRFNYQPMVVALLKALAEKGALNDIIEDAKKAKNPDAKN